jgi:ABC-2 type transport system ATP-binding protein
MKVGECLVFLAGIKGVAGAEAAKRARSWLERLGLGDCWEKKVQELSKGMQQKTQFIATILHAPDLVILDEPFAGLDPINMDVLRDIMLEIHERGSTIIFSTHVMETVEQLCDRVGMINGGRKVLDGRLQEIKGRYGRNTVALAFDGDGGFLENNPLVKRLTPGNGYVEVLLREGADPQALLTQAVSRVKISRFEIVEPSMHDIFIDRVRETEGGAQAAEPYSSRRVGEAGALDVPAGVVH